MVFKKSLTPLSKRGQIVANKGKGSVMQRPSPGQRQSVTGGSPMGSATSSYPAAPRPMPPPTSAPPLGGPPLGSAPQPQGTIGPSPTAGMPPPPDQV